MEVTISTEDLKPTHSISTKDCIDNMVSTLRLLRVAHAPLFDELKGNESLLDSELSLVLLVLICGSKHLVAVIHSSGHSRHLGHAQSDAIGADISCAEDRVVLFIRHELLALIGFDSRHI